MLYVVILKYYCCRKSRRPPPSCCSSHHKLENYACEQQLAGVTEQLSWGRKPCGADIYHFKGLPFPFLHLIHQTSADLLTHFQQAFSELLLSWQKNIQADAKECQRLLYYFKCLIWKLQNFTWKEIQPYWFISRSILFHADPEKIFNIRFQKQKIVKWLFFFFFFAIC